MVIAVDATPTSRCQVTYHLNIGWQGTPPSGAQPLMPKTLAMPCPAGTVMRTAAVPLSQAVAQHIRYAALPANPKAPTAAERAAIAELIDTKHAALAAATANMVPNSGCGVSSTASLSWSYDDIYFTSQVWWYRTSDCSLVFLDEGYLGTGGIWSGDAFYWETEAYYTDEWGSPFWGSLNSYTGYSYNINRNEAPQHWYRQQTQLDYANGGWDRFWTYVAVCN